MRMNPRNLSYASLVWMLVALPLDRPALLSIPTALLLLGAIWQAVQLRTLPAIRDHAWAMGMLLPFVFSLLWGFVTEDSAQYQTDIQVKLSFLLIPPGMMMLGPLSGRQWAGLALAFTVPVTGIAWLSIGDYLLHFEAYQHRLVVNDSLPVITGVQHIYFGVMLACAALIALDAALRATLARRWRLVFGGLFFLAFAAMHVLTTRTGQLSMYAGLLVYGGLFIWQKRAWLLGAGLMAVMVAVPVMAFFALPSFRARIQTTVWDVQESLTGNPSVPLQDLSIGPRFVVMQAAWEIFRAHPVTGTGIADIERETERFLEADPRYRDLERMPHNPHNQYLEYLAGFGIPGLILVLFLIGYPLMNHRLRQSGLMIALMALLATTMMTESILERQVGIALFVLLALLTRHFVVNSSQNLT